MITESFFPSIGGQEIIIDNLASQLVKRGHKVCVIAPKYVGTCASYFTANYRVRYLPCLPVGIFTRFSIYPRFSFFHWLFKFIPWPFYILYYICKERCDIIHAHSITPAATVGMIGKLLSIPIVVTSHGGDLQVQRNINYGARLHPIIAAVIRLTLKFIDKLILVSDHLIRDALDAGERPEKIEVVHNFVNLNKIKAGHGSILKKYGLKKEKYILYIGRLTPEKGIIPLLKTIEEILQPDYGLKFVIAGYGSDEEKLKNHVKASGLEKTVIFTGCVRDTEKWDLYANSLAVLMPSITEAFGLSAIEAMTSGAVVIAINKPPFCEYIENEVTGILVNSIKDFPREITNLMENPKKQLIGENAKKFVERKLSAEIICSKYEEIYKEVLGIA
jgi:glycosyltransferase involved in cell wall biosynthesis